VINGCGDLWISFGERAAHTVGHEAILDYLPGTTCD
jgi:hypothetical protein